jgi:hypothetical protein
MIVLVNRLQREFSLKLSRIESEKLIKRKAELRNEIIPIEILRSLSKQEKIENNIKVSLGNFINHLKRSNFLLTPHFRQQKSFCII